ncbi:PrsW family intramembrane metalloprotease [Candidatus Fermentibacteria bacterium]|nr:PrsW family intramembrane metalloprotease [Candidatus Fermentibacteria bacterium]
MEILAALAAAVPAVLWLVLFYRSDKYDPEPKRLVARTFVVGAVVGIAFAFAYQGLPFIKSGLLMAVVAAPVVEETAKFLCVRWTVYDRKEFNEPVDGMVYAAAAALGFATVENVVYVLTGWSAGGATVGLMVLTGRSVLSVPGHAIFSSFWGLALGWSKKDRGVRPIVRVLAGLMAAMVVHGLFNYLVNMSFLGGLGFLLAVALAWRAVFLLIRRALEDSPFRDSGQLGSDEKKTFGF